MYYDEISDAVEAPRPQDFSPEMTGCCCPTPIPPHYTHEYTGATTSDISVSVDNIDYTISASFATPVLPYVDEKVAAEKAERVSADSELSTLISTESSTRALADSNLQININTVDAKFANYPTTEQMTAAISVESSRAQEQEAALQTNIDSERTRALNNETSIAGALAVEESRAKTVEATKVQGVIETSGNKAIIFNESDGGGAKFENTDGTWSYVGVNNGGSSGLAAQIYAVDSTNSYYGAKLDVYTDGIYYTVGNDPVATRKNDDNLLVVKKDIKDIGKALKYIGMTTLASGETLADAANRLCQEKGLTPTSGYIVIVNYSESSAEMIYDGSAWQQFGDEGNYATKAELSDVKSELQSSISSEASTRQTNDNTLQSNINDEAATRLEADTSLQANIDNEAATRSSEDAVLQTNINAEASTRETADTALQNNLNSESTARESADNLLTTNLNAEVESRQGADTALQTNIDNEASARSSADTTLQNNISVEATSRENADSQLRLDLNQEISDRQTSDATLQSNINNEATARSEADTNLQSNINAESTTRESADTTLQTNITAEETSRISADNNLTNSINAEVSRATGAESGLQESIDTKQDNISDLETIRSGATLGATSVQPSAISDMATKTWVGEQGYLTEHQSLAEYRKSSDQDIIDAGLMTAISGKVDLPNEPVAGQGVNVPYYFDVTYASDKATVRDYTVDLLNKSKTPQTFGLDINCATSSTAGLMSAADKIKLDTPVLPDIPAFSADKKYILGLKPNTTTMAYELCWVEDNMVREGE